MLKTRQKQAKSAPRSRRARLTPRERLARLRQNERAALLDYVARLREKFGDRVQHVILYGSRARGEGDTESDLDVLVVVDKGDYEFHKAVALESFEPSLQHSALISPLIWDEAHYEQQKQWRLLFFRNLKQDGITLWTNPPKSPLSKTGSNVHRTTSRQPA